MKWAHICLLKVLLHPYPTSCAEQKTPPSDSVQSTATEQKAWLTGPLHCPEGKFKKWKWKCEWLSQVRLFVTPWAVARQAPLSMKEKKKHQIN